MTIKKYILICACVVMALEGFIFSSARIKATDHYSEPETVSRISTELVPILISQKIDIPEIETENAFPFTDEEVELVALITLGEAEGECEQGKRLVVDTILNRLYSPSFPDSIHDVIYQANAFECVWNGRLDRCTITDDILELVRDEMGRHSDKNVIFFQTTDYSIYGEPLFQVGNHYFSKEVLV